METQNLTVLGVALAASFLSAIAVEAQTPPAVRVISTFSGTNGANPGSQLIELPSGNLLGVSLSAPYHKKAPNTIFQILKSGAIQTVYTLASDGSQGSIDSGNFGDNGLVQGSDGSIYGLMYANGNFNGAGLVYRFTFPGTFTVLHYFTYDASDCANPVGALVQGADGSLYGAASDGGAFDSGALFRVGLDGSYAKIYDFHQDEVGISPFYGLVAHPNGMIYGLTTISYVGGTANNGAIFQLDPTTLAVSVFAQSVNGFQSLPAVNSDGSLEMFAGAPSTCGGCTAQLLNYGSDGSGPRVDFTVLASQNASVNSPYLTTPMVGVFLSASEPLLDVSLAGASLSLISLPPTIYGNASGGYTLTSGGNLFAVYPQTTKPPYFGVVVELSGGFPKPPPTISGAFPVSVSQGQTVTVLGSHFIGATSVTVAQQAVPYTVEASGAITLKAPAGPVSGAVSVITQGGTATSNAVISVN